MVVFSQKVIPFGKSCCIPEKNGYYRAKCFYSGKSCCVQVIEVLFGQMWLYSCKEVVFGQSGCVHAKWFYSGKVVVFGQNWLYSVKNSCIRASLLYAGKVIVFGQKLLY